MLLNWKPSGQLELGSSEAFFQYSALVNTLYVFSPLLDGVLSAQFGVIDPTTGKFTASGDAAIMTKQTLRADYTEEDSEITGYMYNCYIPTDILTNEGPVGVTVTAQVSSGQTSSDGSAIYQQLTSGIFAFTINQSLSGSVATVAEELAELIEQMNALDDAMTNLEYQAVLISRTRAEAETLEPGSQATAELNKGDDGYAVFSFGIPEGQQGVGIASVTSGSETESEGKTVTEIITTLTDGTKNTFEVAARNGTGVCALQIENGDLVLYTEKTEGLSFGINPNDGWLYVTLEGGE